MGFRLRFFRVTGGLFRGCADMMEGTIQEESLIQLESVAGHGFVVGKRPNAVVEAVRVTNKWEDPNEQPYTNRTSRVTLFVTSTRRQFYRTERGEIRRWRDR